MITCKSCGKEYDEKIGFCPSCKVPAPRPEETAELNLAHENVRKKPSGRLIAIASVSAVVLIGIITAMFILFSQGNSADEQTVLGEKYLSEEKYDEAIAAFKRAAELEPNDPELYIKLADAYLESDDINSAIDVLETGYEFTKDKSIKSKLEDLKYDKYISLGDTAYSGGKYEAAARRYEKAMKIKPTEAKPYLSAAECYTAIGDSDSAKKTLETGYEKTSSEEIKAKLDEMSYSESLEESSSYENSGSSEVSTQENTYSPTVSEITEEIEKTAVGGKVTLKVWAPTANKSFVQSQVNRFKAEYAMDGAVWDIRVVEKGEGNAVNSVAADPTKGADVFQFQTESFAAGVTSGALAEVPAVYQSEIISQNTEDSVKSCTSDEGRLYAYPMSADAGYFLYYNSSVFTEDDVKSFEKLLSKAQSKNAKVLMALDNAWYNASFFYAAGCDISLDASTGATVLSDFDGDKGTAAVKAMAALSEDYKGTFVSAGDDSIIAEYLSSEGLQAVVTGTWNASVLESAWGAENVAAAKLPTVKINGEDTQLHSFGGYRLVGVNSASKFPLASAALASYLTDAEAQKARYDELRLIPTNSELLSSDTLKNDTVVQAIEEQRPYSHSQSVCSQYFWNPIASVGTDIYNGVLKSSDEAGIKSALEKAVQEAERTPE